MGISAILILICHTTGHDVYMSRWLMYVVAQGQIGVDIFLFLSGMGLYHSLSGHSEGIRCWYLRRYRRVLRPYWLITVPLGIVNVLFYDESWWSFLGTITTLQYWISHQAAWFIALLLPLYGLSPWLYRTFKSNGAMKIVTIFIVCYAVALYPLDVSSTSLVGNIQYVMIRVPAFALGMYMAPQIKAKRQLNGKYVLLSFVLGIFIIGTIPNTLSSYFFLIIPLLKVMTDILQTDFSQYKVNRVFSFFGTISLESYLLNTSMPRYIHSVMDIFHVPDYGNYVFYTLVLTIGVTLSVAVNRFCQAIWGK